MRTAITTRGRGGFTLVEVLVSMTILAMVIVAGLSFLSSQTRIFAATVERTTALTRGRYVATTLQRDLRTLGSNLVAGQPGLVYAGPDLVAFNADYASNTPGDIFAVYVDPDAPAGQVSAVPTSVTLPSTGFDYGAVVYRDPSGALGPAELLTFWFEADTLTPASDDFVLYRKVNDAPAELVSDGVRRLSGRSFLQYWTAAPEEAGGGRFTALADSALPLAHSEPYHLSPVDTGTSARVDSIRAVTLRFAVWPEPDTTTVKPVTIDRMIALPNAGVQPVQSCGSPPLLGVAPVPSVTVSPAAVELAWTPGLDEVGGEGDVVRYVLWRRELPDTLWGDPLVSLPAGSANYAYVDASVAPASTYEYALAAQDCTPSLSSMTTSGLVVVP